MAYVILLAVVALVVFVFVAKGVKIVQPLPEGAHRAARKYKGTVEPGLRLIIPFIQNLRPVDMREQVVDVPPQEVITSDNVVVSVDAVIYYEPTEPQKLVYNVANFMMAVTKLAQTNLRNVVGDMQLDEALTSRDKINLELREILDDATDKWGVRVARVEIQRIDPPPDVMHSMHEQMKAERTRRAVVTSAEGERQAAITRAEGEQKAVILRAEGDKQQRILRAEGEADGHPAGGRGRAVPPGDGGRGRGRGDHVGVRRHPRAGTRHAAAHDQVPGGADRHGRRPRHQDRRADRAGRHRRLAHGGRRPRCRAATAPAATARPPDAPPPGPDDTKPVMHDHPHAPPPPDA